MNIYVNIFKWIRWHVLKKQAEIGGPVHSMWSALAIHMQQLLCICTSTTHNDNRRLSSPITAENYGIKQHKQTVKLAEQYNFPCHWQKQHTHPCIQSTASAHALQMDDKGQENLSAQFIHATIINWLGKKKEKSLLGSIWTHYLVILKNVFIPVFRYILNNLNHQLLAKASGLPSFHHISCIMSMCLTVPMV